MTVRNLEALFRASSLVILGAAESPAQRQLLNNLQASLQPERCVQITKKTGIAVLPKVEAAVVLRADWADAACIDALGTRGCKALLWMADKPPGADVLHAARPHLMRLLGPRSAGLIHTGKPRDHDRNFSTLTSTPQPGTVALIAQSQSVAAAALDWAAGRGIGFSWLAVTGAEADVDAADLLDYAALDPQTRAVVLQIGNIRQGRKFMSAARAAARVKPVLVLQTQRADVAGNGGSDPVRSAAFRRAGLVECESLVGLFEGLAALELLPSVSGNRIAVLGNGSGVCALAVDAVLRQNLQVAEFTAYTRQQIAERIPQVRFMSEAADLGTAADGDIVAALRTVLADSSISAVLLIHSPMAGHPHQTLADAIAKADLDQRLLTVWLGLHSAQAARQRSAAAHLATFASADEAVRAVRFRAQYRDTREMLGQTPPADSSPSIDRDATAQSLRGFCAKGLLQLSARDSASVLARYGLVAAEHYPDVATSRIRVRAEQHAELGMVLSVQTEPGGARDLPAFGLPPLDDLLARRMLDAAGCISATTPPTAVTSMTTALIRIGQLVIDQALIRRLDVAIGSAVDGKQVKLPDCMVEVSDQDVPETQRIALAPYPVALTQQITLAAGRRYQVRAVRPDDEPALLRFLARLDPEEIRLRYFMAIRHFSHDMAARVTQVDYDRELTLVASHDEAPGEIIAMATLVADPDGLEAEYAVLVHHEYVRQGLGRHLLKRLLEIAHGRGIGKVHGDVLAENRPMLDLARSLGFVVMAVPDDPGCRRVEIDPGDDTALGQLAGA
ncbi:GNAT family N-acetyltransferase [uncultured Nevskia sp.]|uniref:bifunctional acetate--CoA ligase family protein/GNAT family N-acetyltransferase n=1 Tax=uncultured Nevskia sp. TaxID=228950 RepID=UPI0025FB6963|nr:GNAT family N-acetyltransferase [uncultured Nevskia sp.]